MLRLLFSVFVFSIVCSSSIAAAQGLTPSAIEQSRYLLQEAQAQYGESHPEVAKALHALGSAYEREKQWAQAELFYKRALQICEKELGWNHPKAASILRSLAYLYHEVNKPEDYHYLCKRLKNMWALSPAFRDAYLNDHLRDAQLRVQNQQYQTAVRSLEELLVFVNVYSSDRSELIAQIFSYLAQLNQSLGNEKRALEFYKSALFILMKDHHHKTEEIASTLNNIGWTYGLLQEKQRALYAYKQSLRLLLRHHESGHPGILTILKNASYLVRS